jgi:hypothetical protein
MHRYIVPIVAALTLVAQESQKTTALGNPLKFQLVFPVENTGFHESYPTFGNYTFLMRSLAELEGGPHAHPIPLCEKAETHSGPSSVASELPNLRRAEFPQRRPAEPGTFRFGVSETSSNALADQTAFEFRNCPENGKHHLACRRRRINRFGKRNELDSEGAECLKRSQQMAYAPGKPIKFPHRHYRKSSSMCFCHQAVQLRPRMLLRSGYASVHEFGSNVPAAVLAKLSEL